MSIQDPRYAQRRDQRLVTDDRPTMTPKTVASIIVMICVIIISVATVSDWNVGLGALFAMGFAAFLPVKKAVAGPPLSAPQMLKRFIFPLLVAATGAIALIFGDVGRWLWVFVTMGYAVMFLVRSEIMQ